MYVNTTKPHPSPIAVRLRVAKTAGCLPGTPVLFYGEEIGMGENLEIEGRLAVRVPMQWTSGPGGGFSTAGRNPPMPNTPTVPRTPTRTKAARQPK